MAVTIYPAILSPYPSDRPVAVRRVDPAHYPKWDGLCIKLGKIGISLSWKRK